MQHPVGRLIDPVHLRVANLDASRRFHGAVLESTPSVVIEAA